ncbi:MAG: DUF1273 family protein [Clostridia bacterium]|nr:DUF1273 family protein [Clostridia bacterium]
MVGERIERVCFTGHRVLSCDEREGLSRLLETMLRNLIVNYGTHTFIAGGAVGFDTMAAECVLRLKREYPKIRLELILPCPDQDKRWRSDERALYREILERADAHSYVTPYYYGGCMHERNRRMVDASELCLAYCRKGASGGTAYTVDYAQIKDVMVVNLAELIG